MCNIIETVFHSAHGIWVKLVSNWEQSMLCTKILQVLHKKGIYMLTGLKVFSLTFKYVFYRLKLNAKAEPHGIEFGKP